MHRTCRMSAFARATSALGFSLLAAGTSLGCEGVEPEAFEAAPPDLLAAELPDDDDVPEADARASGIKLTGVRAIGRDCGPESARVSGDLNGSYRVEFDRLEATFDLQRTLVSNDCAVVFEYEGPPEHAYALESFTLDGSASLDRGVNGKVSVFAGMAGRGPKTRSDGSVVSRTKHFDGPVAGAFTFTDTFAPADLFFTPCGSNRPFYLNVGAFAAVESSKSGPGGSVAIKALRDVTFTLKKCRPER